jgi:ABC-2 type transport system permease protein
MNNLMWLIKREYWENKNLYLKAPAIIGVLMLLFVCGVLLVTMHHTINVKFVDIGKLTGETVAVLKLNMVSRSEGIADPIIHMYYLGFISVLLLICIVASYSYLGSALLSDRMDKSILFWKSLPISDTATVVSKLAFPLVIGPLITIVFAEIVFLCLILLSGIAGWFYDIPIFTIYAKNWEIFLQPLKMLALLPVYILWALPCVAWILMVSAWAKSRALVWALGVPLLIMTAIPFLVKQLGIDHQVLLWGTEIFTHLIFGLFPFEWIMPAAIEMKTPQQISDLWLYGLKTLSGWKIWVGAALGVLMLYATVQLRRYRTEV